MSAYWITRSSGQRQTWKTSSAIISSITTSIDVILDGMAPLQSVQQTEKLSTSINIDGRSTAGGYLNYPLRFELRIRQGQGFNTAYTYMLYTPSTNNSQ
jgi:hypothetical protein